MFNIKQKMSRVMSTSMDRNTQNQEEFNIIQDKIRHVKTEISNKLNHLRNRRIFDNAYANGSANEQKNGKSRFAPINIALTELKDATEVIDRELIKQREEIRMLIKQLYNQDV